MSAKHREPGPEAAPAEHPRRPSRGVGAALVAAAAACAALSGCAASLRVPDTQVATVERVRRAEPSEIALKATLDRAALAKIAAGFDLPAIDVRERHGPTSIRLAATPDKPQVRLADDRLCVSVAWRGSGEVALLGKRVRRQLSGTVTGCAAPRLRRDGKLTLGDPSVRVSLERGAIALATGALFDALERQLGARAGPALRTWLASVAIPAVELLDRPRRALTRPWPLAEGACVHPGAERIELAQPRISRRGLVLAGRLIARPVVELPCTPRRTAALPAVRVVEALRHQPTRLLIPVGVGFQRIEDELSDALRRRGPLRFEGGAVTLSKPRVGVAEGELVVRTAVSGHARGSWLGIPMRKRVEGDVAFAGPVVRRDQRWQLASPRVAFESEDALTTLAAALRADALRAAIAKHVVLDITKLTEHARAQLSALDAGIGEGDERVPVRVDLQRLDVRELALVGGRAVALVAAEAWIVVGDEAATGRRRSGQLPAGWPRPSAQAWVSADARRSTCP